MNKKLILVIALIGIGLYALPATMSLFAGQHSFVNIDATGNQIDCTKCHGDVKAELAAGAVGTDAPHAGFECEFCHRVRAGEASGDNAYSAITYTAVSVTDPLVTIRRTLVVTERDMEAGNVPVSMSATATTSGTPPVIVLPTGTIGLSGEEILKVPGYKYSLSACYKTATAPAGTVATQVSCDTNELLQTLDVPDPRFFQASSLYNSATAVLPLIANAPLDNDLGTQKGTFDASKVKFAWAGSPPRYGTTWTWSLQAGGYLDGTIATPNYGFNKAGSEVSNAGTLYHAASLVSCMECHGGEAPTGHHDAEYGVGTGCNACHYAGGANKGGLAGIMAGGFGLGVTGQDDGALEVHKAFVKNADGVLVSEASPVMNAAASNTACVACHTHVEVDIAYNKPTTVVMSASMGTTSGNAAMGTVVAGGSTVTYSGTDTAVYVPADPQVNP